MDVSGDVADLMVKESIQLTEASIKLLAAGGTSLAALLWALAKDNKKFRDFQGGQRRPVQGLPGLYRVAGGRGNHSCVLLPEFPGASPAG